MAKMGRPTENPKTIQLTTRIDSQTNDILVQYCTDNKVSKNEGVREGIKRLVDTKK